MDEDALWQAVEQRDARYDGRFVMGVRSTGIYCRPVCPARLPRRAVVVFFSDPQAAEQAGFRACKRCRPNDPSAPPQALAERAMRLIEAALDGPEPAAPTLQALGSALGVSPYHLQRTFKAVTGLSPRQYAAARRASALKSHLRGGSPVTEAVYEAGYTSSSRIYEQTGAALGMTPGAYRRGGAGMEIRYTTFDTPLGCLLIAATERGVCALQLGDDPSALGEALAAEFPQATLRPDDDGLAEAAAALREHLTGRRPLLDLPLDVRGTAFQQRVWAELRKIPYGQTRTYTQVAKAIGQPNAVRAVARACATNPAALVIPCHRVVRAGGALAGYRWGLARKKTLLENETT